MKGERGKLSFPVEYEELRGKRGWYAQQKDSFTSMIRKSVERYDTREDLVAALAFGKHQWDKWEIGNGR